MSSIDNWSIMFLSESKNITFLSKTSFILSTLGMAFSILSMMMLILTTILFSEWRHSYKNQLLLQFMLARFIFSFVRYFYDLIKYLKICTEYFNPIYLGQFPLAYTEMALVTWMFVFSKQMHDSLVRVFNTESTDLLKVSLAAWLIPGALSIITFLIFNMQIGKEIQIYVIYLFLIKWPTLCVNGILLISSLRSVINTNTSKTENNPRIILVMIILLFTFSIQQAATDFHKLAFIIFHFEDFTPGVPLFFVFTNIFSIYHCTISILFWLFGNKRTRVLWGFSNYRKQSEQSSCSTIS
ncbi:unnamed protein product [Euphydryas editha]|uniref:G-protein coupled receptors family 2 profile 2 domain-containing protein n=1 Tax=Euphydryas editha TaxID=104508 RepID=A0AAU9VA71_EUPED|nr:unnamed protein product [Euphydryas editha]